MQQTYKKIDESTLYESQVNNSVRYLQSAFNAACNKYRAKVTADGKKVATHLSRSLKTRKPIIDGESDLTLYYAQIEFSYILDVIMRGPVFLAANEIKRCNDFINSISEASK